MKNKIVDITNDIKWIGALDPNLVTFDVVMETKFGTTYNSYFIDAEKKAIVETVKERFHEEYIDKIKELTDPSEIQYIIMDHTEPDHSGSLKQLLKVAPNATVVGTRSAIRFLREMINHEFKSLIVKGGDTLDLGNKTLKFIDAPFLHWPDSMYTYLVEDKVLFTCDSFGCHYCDDKIFNDLAGDFTEAYRYYFDVIISPFSKYLLEAIDRIKDLEIDLIAVGHGPVLRENVWEYVNTYKEWAIEKVNTRQQGRVFIPYVSAYGYTKKVAEAIAVGVEEEGLMADLCDIETMHVADVAIKVELSDGLIIGSPTINQNILPQIYDLFSVVNPITNRGKLTAAFGSYGWSGEAVDIIESLSKALKLKVYEKGLKITFLPDAEICCTCRDFGKSFAQSIKEK
ncbi:FprA family A-type flavoprotein [Alkaliphilus hydrothermalis]|uniref:Flavorubredoxin n=1 Tax=Alkaliphilus hydrothermalis TaxID=1482730 RepID=A0ABS2NRK2_9FIRM|nr:FprA family A-type flavoprotein [Alkaliphilus hydrothermalis]MBM7615556.1 flavorubredoxin [Alkaliphilus hydrothermalis]